MSLDPLPILQSTFGFPDFRGVQRQVVDRVLAGANTLAVMPTGAGKSLCYQLPAVTLDGCCVVVSPLIALMHDQLRAAEAIGIRAATLTSVDTNQMDTIRRFRAGELDLSMSRRNAPRAAGSATCWHRRNSACLRSTRRIACRNGGMISAPITACCARCSTPSRRCRGSR